MMTFRRFLRDRRRSLIGWCLGTSLYIIFQNAFYPSFKDQADLTRMMEDLPDSVKALFGISEVVPLTSPPGWLWGQVFSLLPVLLIIYAVSLGTRALATSEEDGTLELILSNPISRGRVLLERYLGFLVLVFVVGTVSTGLTLATAPLLSLTEGVSLVGYAAGSFAAIALGWLFGSIAFVVGAVTGRRSMSITVAASIAVGTYTINGISGAVEAARSLRYVSPFHWFLGRNMLAQGVAPEAVILPVVIAAVLAAVAYRAFPARDLRSS